MITCVTFNQMSFTICEATEDNDETIANLFYKMALDVNMSLVHSDHAIITTSYLKNFRTAYTIKSFLALSPSGAVIGTATAQRQPDLYPPIFQSRVDGYIWGVYVEPEWRTQGIGKALTERCMEHCKDLGCTRVILNAAPMGKPVYERLGFVPGNVMVYHVKNPVAETDVKKGDENI